MWKSSMLDIVMCVGQAKLGVVFMGTKIIRVMIKGLLFTKFGHYGLSFGSKGFSMGIWEYVTNEKVMNNMLSS